MVPDQLACGRVDERWHVVKVEPVTLVRLSSMSVAVVATIAVGGARGTVDDDGKGRRGDVGFQEAEI